MCRPPELLRLECRPLGWSLELCVAITGAVVGLLDYLDWDCFLLIRRHGVLTAASVVFFPRRRRVEHRWTAAMGAESTEFWVKT